MMAYEMGTAAEVYEETAKQLIPDDVEREQMFNVLRNYQESLDLPHLLDELKDIINEPNRLELFDAIRPLIPLKHQLDYDRLAPPIPSHRLRVIRLQRRPNESLGFAVRGGYEHGVGIYVSQVDPDSQAYHYGLRIGDEVVRVNGFTIDQAIHEEVLNLIRAKPEIVLKVRTVGMIPLRENVSDRVTWKFVEQPDQSQHSMSWQVTEKAGHKRSPVRYSKLYVNLRGVSGLGCSICSGPTDFPGVFLQSIKAGSLAEEAGLSVGDQLIDVNGTSFLNISHSEAVVALKSSSELYITLLKGAGLKLFELDHPTPAHQVAEEEKIREFQRREREEKERRILADEERRRKEREEQERKQQQEREEAERQELAAQERRDEARRREEEELRQQVEAKQQQDRLRKEAADKARELQESRDRERQRLENSKLEGRLPDIKVSSPSSDRWERSTSGPAFHNRPLQIESEFDNEDATFDPKKLFNPMEIDGRQINMVKVKRDGPLDIDIEGGLGTPLGGRVVISEVFPDGNVHKQGGIHRGDQLMMVDGLRLVDVTLTEAQSILDRVPARQGAYVKLVVAKSPPKNYEDEVTYF